MAAAVHHCRAPLRRALSRWPAGGAFWFAGWIGGLLTESFAILGNLSKPPAERILLHPRPPVDLLFGTIYYGLFMGLWVFLRNRWSFSKSGVFVISGLFGLATEQGGAILRGIVAQPIWGGLLGILVMSVYGIFPAQAAFLTEGRWPARARPGLRAIGAAALGFFLFGAAYGLGVHRALLAVFPKS